MAQLERIINVNDVNIISINSDPSMGGSAIDTIGIWYSPAELTQIRDALTRAIDYLNSEGIN